MYYAHTGETNIISPVQFKPGESYLSYLVQQMSKELCCRGVNETVRCLHKFYSYVWDVNELVINQTMQLIVTSSILGFQLIRHEQASKQNFNTTMPEQGSDPPTPWLSFRFILRATKQLVAKPVTKPVWRSVCPLWSLKKCRVQMSRTSRFLHRLLSVNSSQLRLDRAGVKLVVAWQWTPSCCCLCVWGVVPQVKWTDGCIQCFLIKRWRWHLHWYQLVRVFENPAVIQWGPGVIKFQLVMMSNFDAGLWAFLNMVKISIPEVMKLGLA